MKKLATTVIAMVAFASTALAASDVVISQVYGGGGNSGATYKNDFVEIFNRGVCPVDITGWSIQYGSATGSTVGGSGFTTTLSGVLQPGQYYLVQEAAGTGGTTPLPTPDATGSIAMSATAGKVALCNSATQAPACPAGQPGVADFVGYGSTANCSETAPTATLSNTNAALRGSGGCTDTDNNSSDFSTGAPTPRNTATTLAPCSTQLCVTDSRKSTWGTIKTLYR